MLAELLPTTSKALALKEEAWYLLSLRFFSAVPGADADGSHLLKLFVLSSTPSRAKVVAADGPPGNPAQALTPVRHTVTLDKDILLQNYGFHISETLPLTVVAVTAGKGWWRNMKRSWPLRQSAWASPPLSLACKKRQKMLPGKLENCDLLLPWTFYLLLVPEWSGPRNTCYSEP